MNLSERIRNLAIDLGADPRKDVRSVRFSQRGRMRKTGSSRWMYFRAQQTIGTKKCWFDWNAKVGPAGFVSVRDALIDEEGCLDVSALGFIPVAHAKATADLTRGELMRYLAELPWNPDAILHNGTLHWKEDGSNDLFVSAGLGTVNAKVKLHLDGNRKIVEVYAPDRPREVDGKFVPTPWLGRFFDYECQQGRLIPMRAEVAWLVEGIETVCWEGRIEDWHTG